jgi:transaldolase
VKSQPSRASKAPRTALVTKAILSEEKSAPANTQTFANQLEALKAVSTVVADTGEIESIRAFRPVDSTTNPSLVLKAVQNPQYEHFLAEAISQQTGPVTDASRPYANIADALAVNIGAELLKIVPGRVSTEVDAHLSFDTQATVDKALRLVDLYAKKGIDTKRIYIKMASTWEGIRACEILQKQDIDCNLTLLFSFAQAGACADAGAALISPFVGRILDWYKKNEGKDYAPHEDPGVKSVHQIYKYYKKYGYKTIVMAASFRNIGEIRELAGCDNITISPALLKELADSTEPLPRKLWPTMGGYDGDQLDLTGNGKALFEKEHNADQMAVDKLKEGIDGFAADQRKLETMIGALISAKK